MSSRQMAYAAVEGRKITFNFASTGVPAIHGYLVGMDDFHWLVAEIEVDGGQVHTTLVHKASAATVRISRYSALDAETDAVRQSVEELGQPFFDWCEANYFNGNGQHPRPHQRRVASTR